MSSSALTGNTSGLATATSPGLVGTSTQTFAGAKTFQDGLAFTSASLSNAQATILGLKQYLHGTTYNSGIAPTVSGSGITSITSGKFIPYQCQGGEWRLRFNIFAVYSPAVSSGTVNINLGVGVTFDVSCSISGLGLNAYSNGAAANIAWASVSGTVTNFIVSGDVSLSAKPTWAY